MNFMGDLLSKLKNSIFWRSVAVLVSGTALAQFIGVITTPIVSRLYDPKAFGEYAIIISTVTIFSNTVTFGLNSAVMMPVDDSESEDIFQVAFFTMLLSATAGFLVLLSISSVVRLFDPGINYIVACIFVYVLVIINNLKGLLEIFSNRKRLNRVLFYNSLIGALATLCITVPLGFLKTGCIGMVIAAIAAGVISILQMLRHNNPFRKIPCISTFKSVYSKYRDFIMFQYPSNFIENFAIQLPNQVFSAIFGNANLGSYSMNEKILGIPSRLIGNPISTIYFRTASEYSKEGKNLADFTFLLITRIMLIAYIPILITIIWGEKIFTWVLGSNWSDAGSMAGFLIVQYVFMFCANCTSYCRVAIGKQKVNLAVSILRVLIIGASLFIGVKLFDDLFNAIILFSMGTSIYLILDMAFNFYCMGRNYLKYIVFSVIYIFTIETILFFVH